MYPILSCVISYFVILFLIIFYSKETYGKYLSIDELTELMKPSARSISIILDWIMLSKWDQYELDWTHNLDMITITVPASVVAETLQVKYSLFEHIETGQKTVATLGILLFDLSLFVF